MAQLRARTWASLLLALLVGVAGALVLAAAAGARRSEAALPRFLAANQTMDTDVGILTDDPADDLAEARRRVAALREVRQVVRVSGAAVGALVLAGVDPADPGRWHRQLGVVALDPGGGVAFGRPIVVAGRLPDQRRPEEAAIDEELATRRHLRVGGRYRVGAFTLQQLGPAGEGRPVAPKGAVADLRVVGIVRYPKDLVPVVTDQDNLFVNTGELYLTPAYWRRYGPDIARYGIGLSVALRHGQADLPRLRADLRRLFGDLAADSERVVSDEMVTAGTRRAIRFGVGGVGRVRAVGCVGRPAAGGPDARPPDPPGGHRVPDPAGPRHDPGPADRGSHGARGAHRGGRGGAGRRWRGSAVPGDAAWGGATS
jgi:hypothetical protein